MFRPLPPQPAPPDTRRFGWGTLISWALALSLTAAGLRNALAPEPGLEAHARELACAGPTPMPPPTSPAIPTATATGSAASPKPTGKPATPPAAKPAASPAATMCRLQPTRWESGPIGRHFEFQDAPGARPVRVQCRREYIALGDYRCVVVP